jgi:hypothetical protein
VTRVVGWGRVGSRAIDAERRLGPMDGFIQAIGSGIAGLVVGSFSIIGQTLRAIVDTLNRALPVGMLPVIVFVFLLVTAWQLIKR